MEAPSESPSKDSTNSVEELREQVQSAEIRDGMTQLTIITVTPQEESSPSVEANLASDNRSREIRRKKNFEVPSRPTNNQRARYPSQRAGHGMPYTQASMPRPHINGGEWVHPLNPQLLSSVRQGYGVPPPAAPWLPMAPCLPPAPWLPMTPCLPPTPWLPPASWWPTAHCLPPVPWCSSASPWTSPPPCLPIGPWLPMSPTLPAFLPRASTHWSPVFAPQPVAIRISSQQRDTSSAPPYTSPMHPPPPYSSFFMNTLPPYSANSPNPHTMLYSSPSLNSPPPAYSASSPTINPVESAYSTPSPTINPAESADSPPSSNSPAPEDSSSPLNSDTPPNSSPSSNSPSPEHSSTPRNSTTPSNPSPSSNPPSSPHSISPLNPDALPYSSSPQVSPLTVPPSDPWIPSAESSETPVAEPLFFTDAPFSENPMFSTVWKPLPTEHFATSKGKSHTSCAVNGD